MWPLLKEKGILLYTTCSILNAENTQQIQKFISKTASAREIIIEADWGIACKHGRQLLPLHSSHDGFYYALLQKC